MDFEVDPKWKSSQSPCEKCGDSDAPRIFSQSLVTKQKHVTCLKCTDPDTQLGDLRIPTALTLPEGATVNSLMEMLLIAITKITLKKAESMGLTLPSGVMHGELVWEGEQE